MFSVYSAKLQGWYATNLHNPKLCSDSLVDKPNKLSYILHLRAINMGPVIFRKRSSVCDYLTSYVAILAYISDNILQVLFLFRSQCCRFIQEGGELVHCHLSVNTNYGPDEDSNMVSTFTMTHKGIILFPTSQLFPKNPLEFINILTCNFFQILNLMKHRRIDIGHQLIHHTLTIGVRHSEGIFDFSTLRYGIFNINRKCFPAISSQVPDKIT